MAGVGLRTRRSVDLQKPELSICRDSRRDRQRADGATRIGEGMVARDLALTIRRATMVAKGRLVADG